MAPSTTLNPASPSSEATMSNKMSRARMARRLGELGQTIQGHDNHVKLELKNIKEGLEELERRRELDAARAAVRHDILFSALKKIHEEFRKLKAEPEPPVGASPQSASKKPRDGRKNLERCLVQYTQDLEAATTVHEVKNAGKLCADYSEAILRTI